MTGPASAELSALRRTVALGWVMRTVVTMLMVSGAMMIVLPASRLAGSAIFAGGAVLYMVLVWRALQVSREALEAPEFIARGNFAEAEKLLTASLRRFSIFPGQRVVELHHLAVLRQGQGRFAEAAELAGGVLSMRASQPIQLGARMVRLESLLELHELHGAHLMLMGLMAYPMGLAQQVRLLAARCRYESLVGAWAHLLHDLPVKLQLTDAMPPKLFGLTHARLALAARRLGKDSLGRWLLARGMAVMPPVDDLTGEFSDLGDWIKASAGST